MASTTRSRELLSPPTERLLPRSGRVRIPLRVRSILHQSCHMLREVDKVVLLLRSLATRLMCHGQTDAAQRRHLTCRAAERRPHMPHLVRIVPLLGRAIVPRRQPRCDLTATKPEAARGVPPGSGGLDANRASRGTTLGDSSPEKEAVPADGTKTNDHQSKGHDAPILPWGCSAFDVGDSCDVGAILAMRRG